MLPCSSLKRRNARRISVGPWESRSTPSISRATSADPGNSSLRESRSVTLELQNRLMCFDHRGFSGALGIIMDTDADVRSFKYTEK